MKLQIYQAYYDPSQIPHLDLEFIPLDNTNNPQPNLREYPLFLECRQRALADGADLWGYFSWKWKDKLCGLTPQFVFDHIQNNPGYDVYFFNWYKATPYFNVWEQGSHCHREIIEIMEAAFPLMGLDSNILYKPMPNSISFYALYCVGNRKWWDGLIDFTTRFINVIPQLPDSVRVLYERSAGYRNDLSLNYFAFIHERLLSTYILLNQDTIKVLPYHHEPDTPFESMLEDIKSACIQKQSEDLKTVWFRLRNAAFRLT
jgi:hypothetical protein